MNIIKIKLSLAPATAPSECITFLDHTVEKNGVDTMHNYMYSPSFYNNLCPEMSEEEKREREPRKKKMSVNSLAGALA